MGLVFRFQGLARLPRLHVAAVEDPLLYDTTAEHLEPLAIEEDLKLKGRIGEGEVGVDPPLLHLVHDSGFRV